MDVERAKARLEGCYITVPTMFRDPDLDLDLDATRRVVRFLLERGINQRYGTLLAGGAAGDFSTMTFDERLRVAEAVVAGSDGRVPVAMGAQTTSTLELRRLAKAAERIGAEFIQVSPPFYFAHTEADFHEYVAEAAAAADVGIIVYNTFWTSAAVSFATVEKLVEIPNVVGLKWACPRTDAMEFEDVVSTFAGRLTVIDNHLMFALSHMLGARAFEVHLCNYWPEWGIRLIDNLRAGDYPAVQRALVREAMPFYKLWLEIEQTFTSGDGYMDKLCMELVGLDSSRCRPPTRDVRSAYRERCRQMLIETGVPGVVGG
jgi:dihydrodipicolinate synthase/N-acetylneuraminate lyase